MRVVRAYRPPGKETVTIIDQFLSKLDPKFQRKLRRQFFLLAHTPRNQLIEPHYKHFSLERYSSLYELREKRGIAVRVIFALWDNDVILLVPFIKKCPRDTLRALEKSLSLLSQLRADPKLAVKYEFQKEELQ